MPLTLVWPSYAGRLDIDFDAGDKVPKRKLVIIPGLNTADGATCGDAVPALRIAVWPRHIDREGKGEMIDPAADIDARVKAGPTEFGGRRRLKSG